MVTHSHVSRKIYLEVLMSNPFELRLQLFQEARDYLVDVFNRDVLEWDRKNQEKLDIETKYSNDWSRYIDLKEEGKVSA